MEPTAEKLCLALHRACRERFERVLQVHPEARVVEEEIRKRQSVRQHVHMCVCVCVCGRLREIKHVHQFLSVDACVQTLDCSHSSHLSHT